MVSAKLFRVWARQAVEKIERDVVHPRLAHQPDAVLDHLEALYAIDRGLHLRVEVLNPEAHARKAKRRKACNVALRHEARVQLDPQPGVVGEARLHFNGVENERQVFGTQKIRGAAAEMHRRRAPPAAEKTADNADLVRQRLHITDGALVPVLHAHIAAAVPAKLPAERDVDVKGDRFVKTDRRERPRVTVRPHGVGKA